MAKFKFFTKMSIAAAVVLMALLASGCESTSSSDDSNGLQTLIVTVAPDGAKYVDLSAGIVLPDSAAASTDWDLKINENRVIQTNSGSTAAGVSSSGEGGVYYAGNPYVAGEALVDSVSAATLTAAKEVFDGTGAWETHRHFDEEIWFSMALPVGMGPPGGGPPATPYTVGMNKISFHGYEEGDGSLGSPYKVMTSDYTEDSFYGPGAEMGQYTMSNNIYIIRHGDGLEHSAIVITGMEKEKDGEENRVYEITYQALD